MNLEMMKARIDELDMMLRQSEANHNALVGRRAEMMMIYENEKLQQENQRHDIEIVEECTENMVAC